MLVLIGGFLLLTAAIFAQSWIVEFAVIKRVMDDPADGFMVSVIVSGLFTIVWSVILVGFAISTIIVPLLATALVLAFNYPRYARLKSERAASADIFK